MDKLYVSINNHVGFEFFSPLHDIPLSDSPWHMPHTPRPDSPRPARPSNPHLRRNRRGFATMTDEIKQAVFNETFKSGYLAKIDVGVRSSLTLKNASKILLQAARDDRTAFLQSNTENQERIAQINSLINERLQHHTTRLQNWPPEIDPLEKIIDSQKVKFLSEENQAVQQFLSK